MRTLAFIFCVVWASSTVANEPRDVDSALERAVAYLWTQQHEDGSWRSEYYGVMKSGQSLTPLATYALLLSTQECSSGELRNSARAIQFILAGLDDRGAVGLSDPDILEYPVYSTAYALEAIKRYSDLSKRSPGLQVADLQPRIERMRRFLIAGQYQEANGFKPTDAAYGGWGFNAPEADGVVGHMDLAHTRKALAALAGHGDPKVLQAIRQRAACFLLLMQKDSRAQALQPHPVEVESSEQLGSYDGGFYFSPIALSANKVPYDQVNHCWPSYATATCDGILALLACGATQDDPRVVAATDWLRKHPEVDHPGGIPMDHPEPWGDAVRFYHYSVRAEVYRQLDFPAEDKERLARAIIRRQRADGSFVNAASPLMKEDDPIVSTSLAIVALANCLK